MTKTKQACWPRFARSGCRAHSFESSIHSFRFALSTVALVGLFAFVPAPSVAEWLVTRDGQSVQTQGAWKAKARSTFFVRPDGVEASIPTRQIDIPSSRDLTRTMRDKAKLQQVFHPTAAPVSVVLRLTDDDVGHIRPSDDVDQRIDVATADLEQSIPGPSDSPREVGAILNWLDRESDTMIVEGRLHGFDGESPIPSQVAIEVLEDGKVIASTVADVVESIDDRPRFRGSIPAPDGPRVIRVRF